METVASLRKAPPALFRWIVLIFISIAMFGNYYIYDSISPLADVLKAQLNFTDSNIGLLNSIYSFPNLIMVLIGGIIIDRIGTKKAALIFAVLVMIGALMTAIKGDVTIMAIGRLIFGLGAESMIVAITTVVAVWFKGKELSFAFGLNLTIARLGSVLALNSPSWARSSYLHWQDPLWIAVGAGIICLLSLVIYFLIDTYAEKNYTLQKEGPQDKIVFKDIFNFGKSFWFISLLCVTFYSAMFPFQTFAVKFFQEAHGTTRELGGFLSSILPITAMVCTPLFGLLSDSIGKRSLLMICGSFLIMPVYLIMGYTNISLFIPVAMMGIAFSLIPAVMWPSVALIVKQSKLGTAYGLMTLIQNIGLFGFNLIIGWANDYAGASATNPQGYHLGMWIFSSLGILALIFAIMLRKNEKGPNAHGLEFGSLHRKK